MKKEKPLSYMKKVHDSAKFRSLRWHYPDQVRSKFNTSSQTVHRLPYIIWTYDNVKQTRCQGNCLQKKRRQTVSQIEDKVLGSQVSKGFSLCKVV